MEILLGVLTLQRRDLGIFGSSQKNLMLCSLLASCHASIFVPFRPSVVRVE